MSIRASSTWTMCTVLAVVTAPAFAQESTTTKDDSATLGGGTITMTDGDVSFTLNNFEGNRTGSNGGLADLRTGVSDDNTDHLFQQWFWYRTTGDSREYALSNLVQNGGGGVNGERFVYVEPSNDGQTDNALLVELQYTLTDLSESNSDRAQLQVAFRIQNLTDGNLNVQFFAYTDIELSGSIGNDRAVLTGASDHRQRILDATTGDVADTTVGSSNQFSWGIDNFPSLRTLLTNGGSDTLPETTSPFGPGDYSGAHQWGVTLAPQSNVVQSAIAGSIVIDIKRATCASDIFPSGGDGQVNVDDLLKLLADWGSCG